MLLISEAANERANDLVDSCDADGAERLAAQIAALLQGRTGSDAMVALALTVATVVASFPRDARLAALESVATLICRQVLPGMVGDDASGGEDDETTPPPRAMYDA
jgi:hypothetical protein